MQRRIRSFDAEWHRKDKRGRIRLSFDDRSSQDLCPLSQEEMTLRFGLLRSGKPVHDDAAAETLSTLPKPLGQEPA